MVLLENNSLTAKIINGEIVRLLAKDGTDYVHRGGDPEKYNLNSNNWPNSGLTMFPIIGKPENFQITSGEETFPMDSHGISRLLPTKIIKPSPTKKQVVFLQTYNGLMVPNTRYSREKQNPPQLKFHPFRIKTTITLDSLIIKKEIEITNTSQSTFQYNIGSHPAFTALGSFGGGIVETPKKEYSLNQIQESKEAIMLTGAHKLRFYNVFTDKQIIMELDNKGFKDAMLWSPNGSDMFCMEPVSNRPDTPRKEIIRPGETEKYSYKIIFDY